MGAALRRDALLVEFLGLPGAGKSALSSRVAGRLRHLPFPVHEPSYGLAHGIGFAARIARKSARVAGEIALHPLQAARAASVLARTAPDLVVKLDVTPETGVQRSPDSAPGEVERKREAVRVIDYGPACRTVEVDTLRPLPEVLLAVKQAVWAEL